MQQGHPACSKNTPRAARAPRVPLEQPAFSKIIARAARTLRPMYDNLSGVHPIFHASITPLSPPQRTRSVSVTSVSLLGRVILY